MSSLAGEIMKENGIKLEKTTAPAGDPPAGDPPAQQEENTDTPPAGDPPAGDPPAGDPPAQDPPPGDPPASEKEELNDEAVLDYLQKKKGLKIDKIEQLNTPPAQLSEEEKAANQKEIHNNAVKFALEKSLVKSEDVQNFYAEVSKSPRELVQPMLIAAWMQKDKELTQEDAEARFAEFAGDETEEGSWQRAQAEANVARIANEYLSQKYGDSMLSVEDRYLEHVEFNERVNAHKTQVEQIFTSSVPKEMDFEFEDAGENGQTEKFKYSFKPSDDTVKAVKELMMSDNYFKSIEKSNLTSDQLTDSIKLAILQKEFPNIVREVAKSHAAKIKLEVQAGRKGIPPQQNGDGTGEAAPPRNRGHAHAILDENKR